MGDSIFDLKDAFEINSPFDENWVEKDFKSTKAPAGSVPTISIEKSSPDTLDVNKKTLMTFIVDGAYSYAGGTRYSIEIVEDYSNLVLTTKKWTSVEKGWKIKTYITAKESGTYTIKFKVDGKDSNSLTLKTTDISGKSKYRVLCFGGIDYKNDGTYGSNATLAKYLEILAASDKYKLPLQKGDIQVVNSPLFANESGGKDVYRDILELVKDNFDTTNGTLVIYGYSWGGQLMMEFLKYFKEDGIDIKLLITVDAAKGYFTFSVNDDVTSNVEHNLNIYQTTASKIGSHGFPNEGDQVTNVDLTGEETPAGDEVVHSNIDEYSLLYCAQVIIYALNGIYTYENYSESEIKEQIKTYADQGY